jgi:hypothetical protein
MAGTTNGKLRIHEYCGSKGNSGYDHKNQLRLVRHPPPPFAQQPTRNPDTGLLRTLILNTMLLVPLLTIQRDLVRVCRGTNLYSVTLLRANLSLLLRRDERRE